MKDILVGDIHFGRRNNETQHNEYLKRLFRLLEEQGADRLIVLGDVFETRDTLNVLTINYAIDVFKSLRKAFKEIIVIKGNHDLYYRDRRDVSSLAIIEPYVDVLVDDHYIEDNRMYVSWLVSGEEYDNIVNISLANNIEYMFGHFEFSGFATNDHYIMEHGVSHKALKHLKWVYSGHYHCHQIRDNVEYCGSPFPFDFNDANDADRGFIIFDTDTGHSERVQSNITRVLSVSYDEFMATSWDDPADSTVRVVIDKDLTPAEYETLTERLSTIGFRDVKTVNKINKIKEVIENAGDVDVQDIRDVDSVVVQYLENMTEVDGVDSLLLKDIYLSATESAN